MQELAAALSALLLLYLVRMPERTQCRRGEPKGFRPIPPPPPPRKR